MDDNGGAAILGGAGVGVHQRRKLFEMRNQYALTDATGRQVGRVEQTQQSPFVFLTRLASDLDVALPVTLEVEDEAGRTVLTLHKPWFRWTVDIHDAVGRHLGSISRQVRLGKARFGLHGPSGEDLGHVAAQNWRARDFDVVDGSGRRFASVTKRWRGLATEAFTDADSYAVEFAPDAGSDQRGLALAAALTVDLVMKQKDT